MSSHRPSPSYHMGGSSPKETTAYICHHPKEARADQALFTARALEHTHRVRNGVPGPINRVARPDALLSTEQSADHTQARPCLHSPSCWQAGSAA